MRVASLSQVVTALAGLALIGGCSQDPTAPGSLEQRSLTQNRMTVAPASATITTGQVLFLKATMTSQYGDEFEPAGVTWTSSSDAIAVVSSHGEVLGMREGRVTITASFDGATQSSAIRVLPGKQGKDQKPQIEEQQL
jgi:uncharacterized protein YjdB